MNGLIGVQQRRSVAEIALSVRDVCKTEIYVLQDVTDTATVLQLRDTCRIVSESLNGITAALCALARKHAATPMPARSNLQQAEP
jgi:hypothetical protein